MFERLEGLLTELAAARRTDSQTRDLRALQARILTIDFDEPRSAVIYCELNRAFHQLIHAMAQSPFLDARQNSNSDMSDFFINQPAGFTPFMADHTTEQQREGNAIVTTP